MATVAPRPASAARRLIGVAKRFGVSAMAVSSLERVLGCPRAFSGCTWPSAYPLMAPLNRRVWNSSLSFTEGAFGPCGVAASAMQYMERDRAINQSGLWLDG